MDINNINENDDLIKEENYEKHIIKSIAHFKKSKYIKIKGKILHYLEKPVLYYICIVLSNNELNPFDNDIIFSFEFIDREIPYISIINDFNEQSLNDNRNYYRCLLKKYDYIFSLDKLDEHINIMECIIQGLENFLTYLNESIAINAFIFFGQYEFDHIYQINDFLINKNEFSFFRINELLNNDKKEEKYIVITKLYFLYFKPLENDYSLAKIIFYQKLKDMKIDFDKYDNKDTYILKLSQTKYEKDIEFEIIERKINNNTKGINLVLNENDTENTYKILEYSKLMKSYISSSNAINFKKYDLVINNYKILFNENKSNFKINDKNSKKIDEYIECLDFYEKILDLYYQLDNKSKQERMNKIISNIIYICSELLNYSQNNDIYLLKIRKYIELQKKENIK